jgi:hypothetical protein
VDARKPIQFGTDKRRKPAPSTPETGEKTGDRTPFWRVRETHPKERDVLRGPQALVPSRKPIQLRRGASRLISRPKPDSFRPGERSARPAHESRFSSGEAPVASFLVLNRTPFGRASAALVPRTKADSAPARRQSLHFSS